MNDHPHLKLVENTRRVEGTPIDLAWGEFTGDVVECDGETCRVYIWNDAYGWRLDLRTPTRQYRPILEKAKPGDPKDAPRAVRRWENKLDALNYAATLGR
jgi:hypothetical protein